MMRKKKMGGVTSHAEHSLGGHSSTIPGHSPGVQDKNFGVVRGIQPAARDGHSANISDDGYMLVFGGDRH